MRSHGLGPVDLTIAPGECLGLSGPSGAGKTLLLRAIADMDPHEGHVCLNRHEAQSVPAPQWRRQVAMLPAESQWWHDRIGDHFDVPDHSLLEVLGFTAEVLEWQVSRCSTGERQRLAIARLLQHRPRVLLLDEPTASLDPLAVQRVETVLNRYRHEVCAALLWVSHDPAQLQRVAERRLQLRSGRVQEVVS